MPSIGASKKEIEREKILDDMRKGAVYETINLEF